MLLKDTAFPDVKIIQDGDGAYVGIATPGGIEACRVSAAFIADMKVLSDYASALRSIRRILGLQLGLSLPKGFCIGIDDEDLAVFCTEVCPMDVMDEYITRKRNSVSAAVTVFLTERPWDTNPLTAEAAREQNFTFDAAAGILGTDGHLNEARTLELPSSIDGRRVTTLKTGCAVSYPYVENLIMPDSVTDMEPLAFYDCIYLKTVRFSDNLRGISEGAFSRCRSLVAAPIPSSVREICSEAFYKCSSLATVFIPDSVVSVGSCAFISVPRIRYRGTAPGYPWGATVGV